MNSVFVFTLQIFSGPNCFLQAVKITISVSETGEIKTSSYYQKGNKNRKEKNSLTSDLNVGLSCTLNISKFFFFVVMERGEKKGRGFKNQYLLEKSKFSDTVING